MVEQNVRVGLSLAQHATVLSAGTVALAGPADKIASHPGLMDTFFGAGGPAGPGTRRPAALTRWPEGRGIVMLDPQPGREQPEPVPATAARTGS